MTIITFTRVLAVFAMAMIPMAIVQARYCYELCVREEYRELVNRGRMKFFGTVCVGIAIFCGAMAVGLLTFF